MRIEELTTREQARVWAATAVEILWDAGDPFDGEVRRHELKKEIELAVLRKLVTHDEPDLTEREFAECVAQARRD
jgi:hypothetical protein